MAFGHGLGKIQDPSGVIKFATNAGFPMPTLFGWAAAVSEFFLGLTLALGSDYTTFEPYDRHNHDSRLLLEFISNDPFRKAGKGIDVSIHLSAVSC